MPASELDVSDLLQRPIYINDQLVGVIKGERNHPNTDRLRTLRVDVEDNIALKYMRKPAETAPVHKDLLRGIDQNGHVIVSKSFRELQRRWRQTIRIEESLYAPEELMDRGVLDSDFLEVGTIQTLHKVKRTFKLMIIELKKQIVINFQLPNTILLPVSTISRSRDFADDLILSKNLPKLLESSTFKQYNSANGPKLPPSDE